MSQIDVQQVKDLRAREGISIFEAKRRVEKQRILMAIDEARNFYELRVLVRTLAEKVL
ncbi:hypothetical protein KEU06_08710 [Pseudaminobacter sp. 19-2017]|uniref:Uncharacterized protein n=1 Tax=Pseudaminobacter soli (ex Zhang et al. 2022) TaxID=2831468 RepID=A0A942I2G2_9HYPH|nr:hypothetical protein [Pseudaminobacter soli]MBS3648708.1 hypothetical protein [Pseudaminobacter soli]